MPRTSSFDEENAAKSIGGWLRFRCRVITVHDMFRSVFPGARENGPQQHELHERVLYADEVYRIQGAIFEVNAQMGAGFLEAVYQECLALEFAARGIPFKAGETLALAYKGQPLSQGYRADFICFNRIIVELKALAALTPEHRAQVLNYLRCTNFKLGLLVNFGCTPKARIERLVL